MYKRANEHYEAAVASAHMDDRIAAPGDLRFAPTTPGVLGWVLVACIFRASSMHLPHISHASPTHLISLASPSHPPHSVGFLRGLDQGCSRRAQDNLRVRDELAETDSPEMDSPAAASAPPPPRPPMPLALPAPTSAAPFPLALSAPSSAPFPLAAIPATALATPIVLEQSKQQRYEQRQRQKLVESPVELASLEADEAHAREGNTRGFLVPTRALKALASSLNVKYDRRPMSDIRTDVVEQLRKRARRE